jgi:uncharacterized protein (DUF433 family)
MSDVTILSIDMIVSNPKIRDGRPIIAETTMRVQDIAIGFAYKGYSVDELIMHYPHLNYAQIHAALAYYYAHKDEIDRQIEEDDTFYQQAKAQGLGQRHPPGGRVTTPKTGAEIAAMLDEMEPSEMVDPEITDPVEWIKAQRRKEADRLKPFWDGEV